MVTFQHCCLSNCAREGVFQETEVSIRSNTVLIINDLSRFDYVVCRCARAGVVQETEVSIRSNTVLMMTYYISTLLSLLLCQGRRCSGNGSAHTQQHRADNDLSRFGYVVVLMMNDYTSTLFSP